ADELVLPAQRRDPATAAHLEPRGGRAVLPVVPAVPGAGVEDTATRGCVCHCHRCARVAWTRGIRMADRQGTGRVLSRPYPRLGTDDRLPDRQWLAARAAARAPAARGRR